MAGGGGGGDGEPEFQIAPMIDVLLVMLIFFMTITSSQVLRVDKTISLPIAPAAQKKDNSKSEVPINVHWDPATKKATVSLEEKVYTNLADMVPILKARTAGDPHYRVIIRGDRALPAIEVSRIMNVCGEGGISDISFSAVNREG